MKTFQNILYAESLIDAEYAYKKGLKIMNFLNGQNMYTIIGVTKKNDVYILDLFLLKAMLQIIIVK